MLVGAVVATACGSGQSALQAGIDEPDTIAPAPSTVAGGSDDGTEPTDSDQLGNGFDRTGDDRADHDRVAAR